MALTCLCLNSSFAETAAESLRKTIKLANKGDANAQYDLGVSYDNGLGVPKNYATAAKWYQKAADQGFVYAQYNLGVLYDNGLGVPKNNTIAVKWYQKAADQGNVEAKNVLKGLN